MTTWDSGLKLISLEAKGTTTGVGFRTPQNFYWPPILDSFFHGGVSLALLDCKQVDYSKIYLSTIHRIEQFEVQNSKKFLGRGSLSPLPRPLPRSFSGFTLDSGFALKSWALRTLNSGFAQFGPPNFWSRVAPLLEAMNKHSIWQQNFIYRMLYADIY